MKIISIFEYSNYKLFVLDWIKSQENKGRGLLTQFAERLQTSNSAISQIFNADRDLNLEQACELCDVFGLSESESEYFFLLVEHSRAGSVKLKKKIQLSIKKVQHEQKKIINRVAKDTVLTEEIKSVYYSSWIYTGLRNLAAVDSIKDMDEISMRLKVDRIKTQAVVQFLIDHGLLTLENGKLKIGAQRTHLESTSPWVSKHHQNWRIKGFEAMQNSNENNLFYTSPMSLSIELAEQIRQQLPEFIKQIIDQVGPSKSETVRCLNIDWFEY